MTAPTNRPAETPDRWRYYFRRLSILLTRFLQALRGPEPKPYVPPGILVTRRTIATLAVPARGYAFDFQMQGVFVWTSDGLERDALEALADRFLPYARHHLKEEAIGLARDIEPHRGADFERRLRQHLERLGDWKYEHRGHQVICRPRVRVRLDDRVQEHIRPYWARLITLDYERELASRRARHADSVSTQWATILERLLEGPVPGGAARMTNEQLAEVVRDLLNEAAAADPLASALNDLDPQSEYEREGYFDLLSRSRPPSAPGPVTRTAGG